MDISFLVEQTVGGGAAADLGLGHIRASGGERSRRPPGAVVPHTAPRRPVSPRVGQAARVQPRLHLPGGVEAVLRGIRPCPHSRVPLRALSRRRGSFPHPQEL